MAERDAGRDPDGSREEREDEAGREERAPQGGGTGQGPAADSTPEPFDEDAAWAAIVAGYGEEPPDPPGARPFRSVEELADLADFKGAESAQGPEGAKDSAFKEPDGKGAAREDADRNSADREDSESSGDTGGNRPTGSSVVFAPGVGPGAGRDSGHGGGPRDYAPEEEDEGHFVPPEPPPLPEADVTSKFAWLAVLGGPLLLLFAVLLGWDMTWWLTTLGVGGFLGGFATLVMRMKGDEDEDDDPGRGAVV